VDAPNTPRPLTTELPHEVGIFTWLLTTHTRLIRADLDAHLVLDTSTSGSHTDELHFPPGYTCSEVYAPRGSPVMPQICKGPNASRCGGPLPSLTCTAAGNGYGVVGYE
jgi:hypothetical protein